MGGVNRFIAALLACGLMHSCDASFLRNRDWPQQLVSAVPSLMGAVQAQAPGLLPQQLVGAVPAPGLQPQIGMAQPQIVTQPPNGVAQPQMEALPAQNVQATPQIPETNSSLHPGASEALASKTKEIESAFKENPFFQLGAQAEKIRRLAVSFPDALESFGIIVVDADKYVHTDEDGADKKQGREDVKKGNPKLPCAEAQRKEEKAADQEYNDLTDPSNQKLLESSMTPQQKSNFEAKSKAQISRQIAIQQARLKNAVKEAKKIAEIREQ